MPIYEYVCPDCKLKFELLRPLSQSDEAATCPTCEKSAERILSSFACFAIGEDGLSSPVGGGSCSGCSSTSCGTCNI